MAIYTNQKAIEQRLNELKDGKIQFDIDVGMLSAKMKTLAAEIDDIQKNDQHIDHNHRKELQLLGHQIVYLMYERILGYPANL